MPECFVRSSASVLPVLLACDICRQLSIFSHVIVSDCTSASCVMPFVFLARAVLLRGVPHGPTLEVPGCQSSSQFSVVLSSIHRYSQFHQTFNLFLHIKLSSNFYFPVR